MTAHVFGIRHHGPGCARALHAALEALSPDVVLVEGPPDANGILDFVGDSDMSPPIALLVHAADDPHNASFYPFAAFSPEWQALRYAAARKIPARFMDLPCSNTLAARGKKGDEAAEPDGVPGEQDAAPEPIDGDRDEPDAGDDDAEEGLREDPIGRLARAAGFSDGERWWDAQIEQRRDATELFDAIAESMVALREGYEERPLERRREAHMRSMLRSAEKEGFQRIAVVCGAWHVPALRTLGPAKTDTALLKGLPKIKVDATWIPWTNSRLSWRSGYGAGIDSPGWYAHVFEHPERAVAIWATMAARLLRERDVDASTANAIETVRLAEALASMRDLPAPGLSEVREAVEAVLCGGDRARLSLIRTELEIGDALGRVPERAGLVPLARDFEQEARRLRLKLTPERVTLELDLRRETDRDRSRLFHRVRVIGVDWGRAVAHGRGSGTFKEAWQICWNPEFAVELSAANIHGSTVELAAARVLAERAHSANLSDLSLSLEVAVAAHLPSALDALLAELDARAATASDARVQMEALLPLSRLVRYGDVRETRAEHLVPVVKALFERVVVGLAPASTGLDDAAAAEMLRAVGAAHAACLLLDDAAVKPDWLGALHALLDVTSAHPRIRGRACRLLLEQGALAEGELGRRTSLALGGGVEPADAGRFIEGLVGGEGLLLAHQTELLATLDEWLTALPDEVFQAELPILRRAFADIAPSDRRSIARHLKGAKPGDRRKPAAEEATVPLDERRVQRVLPVLAQLLGVSDG